MCSQLGKNIIRHKASFSACHHLTEVYLCRIDCLIQMVIKFFPSRSTRQARFIINNRIKTFSALGFLLLFSFLLLNLTGMIQKQANQLKLESLWMIAMSVGNFKLLSAFLYVPQSQFLILPYITMRIQFIQIVPKYICPQINNFSSKQ